MSNTDQHRNHWQRLKGEWAQALGQNKPVKVNIRVLYPPDGTPEPVGLEVSYSIDGESFTRTFRGIPEGYDAIRRPE